MIHRPLRNFIRPFSLFSLLLLSVGQLLAQVSITPGNLTHTEAFNTLPTSGTAAFEQNSTLPNWYAAAALTTTIIAADAGSSTTGRLYSYGTGTASERALGAIGSNTTGNQTFGILLVNNTGAGITSLQVQYTGEQWRNANTTPQKLEFSYRIGGDNITTLPTTSTGQNYTRVEQLDFTGPASAAGTGALNGNDPGNQTALNYTISGLSIPNGTQFLLRWYDANDSGSDSGLSIDDLTVTAATNSSGPTPTITFLPGNPGLSPFTTQAGTPSAPQTYTVSGTNLTADLVITAPAGFEISKGSGYGNSQTLTPTSGVVGPTGISVRLTGAAEGSFTGSISHVSDVASRSVSVNGTVIAVPEGFLPIAEARGKGDGTKASTFGGIAGRVTVSNQFGGTVYLQDATAAIAVFSPAIAAAVQIGDSLQILTGVVTNFNQLKQISNRHGSGAGQVTEDITFQVVGGPLKPVTPKVITVSQLPDYEAQLVSVTNASIRPITPVANQNPVFVLTPDANFAIQDGSGTQQLRLSRFTNIPGNTNPAGPATITGVVGRFNAVTQFQPRFTQDIPGAAPYAPGGGEVPRSQTIDVAAWNIEWLGSTGNGPTNESQQLANAITVLNSLQSDVIVLEEISSTSALTGLLAGMPGYQGNCSPFVSNNPGHEIPANPATPTSIPNGSQQVCILYKTDVLTLLSQQPLLEKAQPLPGYPTDADNFWASGRYPYQWTFLATINGVGQKLTVIGIHAKANESNSGGTPQNESQIAYDRRKYDVKVLYDSLNAQFPNDLLLLAGDINDDVDQTVADVTTTESTYKPFVDDNARYTPISKPLSDNGFRSYLAEENMIDHFIVSNELAPAYVAGSAGVGTPYTFITDYGNTTSDHVPVVARFNPAALNTPFQIVGPIYDCATGQLTIYTAGGNGKTVEYQIVGITGGYVTTNTFTIPAGKRGQTLRIRVRQPKSTGRTYDQLETDFLAYTCSSGRLGMGVDEMVAGLTVHLGQNPVHDVLPVEFRAPAGQPIRLQLTDLNGRPLFLRETRATGFVQRETIRVETLSSGLYLLRAGSADQQKVIKVVKR